MFDLGNFSHHLFERIGGALPLFSKHLELKANAKRISVLICRTKVKIGNKIITNCKNHALVTV